MYSTALSSSDRPAGVTAAAHEGARTLGWAVAVDTDRQVNVRVPLMKGWLQQVVGWQWRAVQQAHTDLLRDSWVTVGWCIFITMCSARSGNERAWSNACTVPWCGYQNSVCPICIRACKLPGIAQCERHMDLFAISTASVRCDHPRPFHSTLPTRVASHHHRVSACGLVPLVGSGPSHTAVAFTRQGVDNTGIYSRCYV
jgi:hypothetical protein